MCLVGRQTLLTSLHFHTTIATIRRAGARREFLDFMVQGKINRGRHTDHLAGHHSIRIKQCPPPPSPTFYRPDARQTDRQTDGQRGQRSDSIGRTILQIVAQKLSDTNLLSACSELWNCILERRQIHEVQEACRKLSHHPTSCSPSLAVTGYESSVK